MKLSIIIPVYNGEFYINTCVKNILKQKLSDFEVIIINDGSNDNTQSICNRLAMLDNRIKVINNKNSGVSESRNIGINIARGEYIAFIDVDDKIDSNIYINMISDIEENKADLVMCSYISEFNNHTEKSKFRWNDRCLRDNEIYENLMTKMISKIDIKGNYNEVIMGSVWRCLFKRKIIMNNNIIFNKNIKYSEDLVFLLKYLKVCNRVFTTNKCYYFYNRKTDLNYSTTQRYIENLEKNYELLDNEILGILEGEHIKKSKMWILRDLTQIYSLCINICKKGSGKSIIYKLNYINTILKVNKFRDKIKILDKNDMYGLNKKTIFCLNNKLYIFIVIYYGNR